MDEELDCDHGSFLTQVRTVVFPQFKVCDTATATHPAQELREAASLYVAHGVVVLQVVQLVPDWWDLTVTNKTFPQVLASNSRGRLHIARLGGRSGYWIYSP